MLSPHAISVLDFDGEVFYLPNALIDISDAVFTDLLKLKEWQNDEGILYGKPYVTARKVIWCANEEFNYPYSGKPRIAIPWPDVIKTIKDRVEQITECHFNACLGNLYHNGQESMGWHSDNEKCMQKGAAIVSVSFGAERRFSFKHKQTGVIENVFLQSGSLLLMKGETQTNWMHALPKSTKIKTPRINLTFRVFDKNKV